VSVDLLIIPAAVVYVVTIVVAVILFIIGMQTVIDNCITA
jgi:hypothetical protein